MFIKKRNFTTQERKLLVEILKSYKDIINNKKTDAINTELKRKTWVKIAQKYNSSDLITESARPEQLRRLWQNMKTRQNSYVAKECHCGLANICKEVYVVPDSNVTKNLMVEVEYSEDSDEKEHSFERPLKKETEYNTDGTLQSNELPHEQAMSTKQTHRESLDSQQSYCQSSDSQPLNCQSLSRQRKLSDSQSACRQSSDSQSACRQSSDSQSACRQSSDSQSTCRQSTDSELPCPQTVNNTAQPLQKNKINYFNQMEEKVRINIMQKEYIDRKRRADELHLFDLKKKELEVEILQMQLREVQSKLRKYIE